MSFRNCTRFAFASLVLASINLAPAQPPAQQKMMITEVCPYSTEAVELVNFTAAVADLTGWVVKWRFNGTTHTSSPLNAQLAPGEILVVRDANGGGPNLNIPGNVGQLLYLPAITVPFGSAVTVGLVDPAGTVIDEVQIQNQTLFPTGAGSVGGTFRGLVQVGQASSGTPSTERIWGLDSDGPSDWCRVVNQTIGRENTGFGQRGSDGFLSVERVVINEVDARLESFLSLSNHTVELENRSATPVDLQHWFLLASSAQGAPLFRANPWPTSTVIPSGAFVVLASNVFGIAPPEMPASTFFFPLNSSSTGFLPLSIIDEYTIALYDDLGRLADMVRTTARASEVVHNHPRPPSAWNDFFGAARRPLGAVGIGRTPGVIDLNTGADWRPTLERSMGLPNTLFADGPGDGSQLDVRLHEGEGNGLTLIVNGGQGAAFAHFYLLFSLVRSDGVGPILGLAPDCLNLFAIYALGGFEPASAILDANGTYRFELPPLTLPSGVRTDNIGIIQSPAFPGGAIRTRVLEFDT